MKNGEKLTTKDYEQILDTLNHFESGCKEIYDKISPFNELIESQLKSIYDIFPSLEAFEELLSVKYKTHYSDHLEILDKIKDMIEKDMNKKLLFYNNQRNSTEK